MPFMMPEPVHKLFLGYCVTLIQGNCRCVVGGNYADISDNSLLFFRQKSEAVRQRRFAEYIPSLSAICILLGRKIVAKS